MSLNEDMHKNMLLNDLHWCHSENRLANSRIKR